MIEFVLCEDNKQEMNIAIQAINKAMAQYDFDYKISKHTLYSKELKEEIENNKDTQRIYILDIELGKISGLEIASKIREKDWNSFIIITTVNKDYKNDVFYSRLVVIDYIIKNAFYIKRLEETLKEILNRMNSQKIFFYKYKNCVNRITYDTILYVEKLPIGKKTQIVTTKGNHFETPYSIVDMKEKLGITFIQTHQSCLVNRDKIERVDYKNGIIYFNEGSSINLISNKHKKELEKYVRSY